MKKSVLAILLCFAVCTTAFYAWRASGGVAAPSVALAKATPKPVLPPVAPAPPEPRIEAPVATAEPAPQAAPAAPAAPEQPKILTAETLKGTKWKDGMVDFVFMPDGRWQMCGRICAKWAVEGDRVRVYSDSSEEEHIFEIRGQSLMFDGKKIGMVPAGATGK